MEKTSRLLSLYSPALDVVSNEAYRIVYGLLNQAEFSEKAIVFRGRVTSVLAPDKHEYEKLENGS